MGERSACASSDRQGRRRTRGWLVGLSVRAGRRVWAGGRRHDDLVRHATRAGLRQPTSTAHPTTRARPIPGATTTPLLPSRRVRLNPIDIRGARLPTPALRDRLDDPRLGRARRARDGATRGMIAARGRQAVRARSRVFSRLLGRSAESGIVCASTPGVRRTARDESMMMTVARRRVAPHPDCFLPDWSRVRFATSLRDDERPHLHDVASR